MGFLPKDYVTHEALVQDASRLGLRSSTTEVLHLDHEQQICVVRATVDGERGCFQGIGDASPRNVSKGIVGAYIRMAETRAISRALRLYLGRGATTAEELDTWEPTPSRQQGAPPQPHRTESAPPPRRPRVVQSAPHGPPEPPEAWEAPTMPTSPQMAQWGPGMAESWPRWEYALRQLIGWDGAQMALSRVGAWTAEQGWGRLSAWDEAARLRWWADRYQWGPACVAACGPKKAAGGAG